MKELLCRVCPNGCLLHVQTEEGRVQVTGNRCPRGVKFAADELAGARRVVRGKVSSQLPGLEAVEVRTTGEIPTELVFKVVRHLKRLQVTRPMRRGEVLEKNLLELGVDLVVDTGEMEGLLEPPQQLD